MKLVNFSNVIEKAFGLDPLNLMRFRDRYLATSLGRDFVVHSVRLSRHLGQFSHEDVMPVASIASTGSVTRRHKPKLECGPMPNVMVALPNTGGALCSTPQSLADAHY